MKPLWIATLAMLIAVPAAAAEPCGGLALSRGAVNVGQPLPVQTAIDGEAAACAQAIGAALRGISALRTVTVAVRMPDAERLNGQGLAVANAWLAALEAGGVARSKLSAVAPAAPAGQPASISIAYTEKAATNPVALAESVGGSVLAGIAPATLAPISGGAMLAAQTSVETKVGGLVTLGLADGSRLRLAERSLLRLGSLHLNDELKRVVELELERGEIEAHVAPGGPGSSFEVNTRTGVAGVRGTEFRVRTDPDGTQVETLTGLVALTGPGGESVEVPAGSRSRVARDGVLSAPTAMLPEPKITEPLQGDWTRKGKLRWGAIKGANLYQIDLARDAEFTLEARSLRSFTTTEPLPDDLPAGKWFWRVTAYEKTGDPGLSSRVYAFTLPE
jgi:ferric-dicitrate binding protein FerR (iron transport regulator)